LAKTLVADGCLAAMAGLVRAAVNIQGLLEISGQAIGILEVSQRGPAGTDGALQRFADRFGQKHAFAAGQAAGSALRPYPRQKQRLVGVDVAHPGNDPAVQEKIAHCQLAASRDPVKMLAIEVTGQRFRAQMPE